MHNTYSRVHDTLSCAHKYIVSCEWQEIMSCADDNKDCCAQDNKLCSQDIMFCKVDNLHIFFAKNIFNQ